MQTLGTLIRTARVHRGWSVPKLGRTARVNPVTIYRIEDGTTRTPERPTVQQLADTLGLAWADVLAVAPHLQDTAGAPEVAGATASGFPRAAQGGAADPAARGGAAAENRDDRLEARLARLRHEILADVRAVVREELEARDDDESATAQPSTFNRYMLRRTATRNRRCTRRRGRRRPTQTSVAHQESAGHAVLTHGMGRAA